MKRGTDLPRLRMEAVRGPLDVDAAISPRHMREPLSLSLHLIEVSHISIRKSSITLRIINMSSKDGMSSPCFTKVHKKLQLSQLLVLYRFVFR